MKPLLVLAFTGLAALSGTALSATGLAAPIGERIRGTIEAAEPGSMTIRTIDGTLGTLVLTKDTKVTYVVKSSLSAITDGSFVGTATKGENPPTALEIHIFPEAMRGTNAGSREWDTIPDTLAGSGLTKSGMTNGTVKASVIPKVKTGMTNGTVSTKAGASGETMMTLTYGNGESRTIAVSPQTQIVAYEPADRSALRSGAKVFVITNREGDTLTAVRAAVGKDGVTPPM